MNFTFTDAFRGMRPGPDVRWQFRWCAGLREIAMVRQLEALVVAIVGE
jgi:hypothetical protein